MGLSEKLSRIQQKMKAPKNLYNSFGKYNYRNAEGILEAFKPFEAEFHVVLVVSDKIIMVGDRVYVQATATFRDCESEEEISASAFAREPEGKKGMDESQITGTASSYARKYALNGLFLLDDSKDPDTDEYRMERDRRDTTSDNGKADAGEKNRILAKRKTIESICKSHNTTPDFICKSNGYVWEEMTESQLENMIASLKARFGDPR